MRFVAAVLATLIAMFGLGLAVPALVGTASACSCAVPDSVPPDLVVISGTVEKQRVGYRNTDIQLRVNSMYGAPPERVTVIRAQSANYTSCGSRFSDGGPITVVVERGGPRWVHPVCANATLTRIAGGPGAVAGAAPVADSPEYRLAGPPKSWLVYLDQPDVYVLAAIAVALTLLAIVGGLRMRRSPPAHSSD